MIDSQSKEPAGYQSPATLLEDLELGLKPIFKNWAAKFKNNMNLLATQEQLSI